LFLSELRDTLLAAGGYLSKEEPIEEVDNTSFQGKSILLVEDVELNREIAEVILQEAGFKVDCALDGLEALKKVEQGADDEYDLILMDIQMPVMDGYEASRRIRKLDNKKKASVPILALTANAFEEDRRTTLEAGMDGHLTKPIRIDELYAAIRKYLK
jgi:CheY-like chemotaxis protein